MTVEITCPYCDKKTFQEPFCEVCGSPIAEIVSMTFLDRLIVWAVGIVLITLAAGTFVGLVKLLMYLAKLLR